MESRVSFPWKDWEECGILGKGTFGSVYRIQKTEYGHVSESAVKVIRVLPDDQRKRELEDSGISLETYLREIRAGIIKEIDIMESLKGASHIVTIEDSSIQELDGGWVVYIRMELLKSLTSLQKERKLSVEDVIELGCDICDALTVCEKRGIIHRDIKPANIFWSELGGFKLGDFGIARYLEYTMAGSTRAGSASYMAPEVYRGEKYGRTVDIYSLGLVLYQLANHGRLPFLPQEGDIGYNTMMEADQRRKSGEVFPDPCFGGQMLGDVLRRACHFQAGNRFQSAAEMKLALLRCADATEIIEKPVSVQERTASSIPINNKAESTEKEILENSKKKKAALPLGIIAAAVIAAGFFFRTEITDFSPERNKEEQAVNAETEKTSEMAVVPEKEDVPEKEAVPEKNAVPENIPVQKPYSGRIWENNGIVYTVYDVQAEGYKSISGCYVDTMSVYHDRIYWRKNDGVENVPCPIISMKMDGSDQVVLTENAYPSTFLSIHDGWLYYNSADGEGNKFSRKINLETRKEEEAPPYMFRNGNEKIWFSTSLEDGSWYVSEPGFQNLKPAGDIRGIRLGVRGYKLYYMEQQEDGTYITCSYDGQTGKREILLTGQPAKSVVSEDGLYFKQVTDGNTVLYRMDLDTGETEQYELGDFHLYMGGGFYEIGNRIYHMRFCPEREPDNTEFWVLDRKTGERTMIGQWYNSNAVNAAKEP